MRLYVPSSGRWQAWQAYQALAQAEAARPCLKGNPYWEALIDTALARHQATSEEV